MNTKKRLDIIMAQAYAYHATHLRRKNMTIYHYRKDGKEQEIRFVSDPEAKGALCAFKAFGYRVKRTNRNLITYEIHAFLETEQERTERERSEIAKIIAGNFCPCGKEYDASDFEWAAFQLQQAGYHRDEGATDERN